jgi:hypothetical protein
VNEQRHERLKCAGGSADAASLAQPHLRTGRGQEIPAVKMGRSVRARSPQE